MIRSSIVYAISFFACSLSYGQNPTWCGTKDLANPSSFDLNWEKLSQENLSQAKNTIEIPFVLNVVAKSDSTLSLDTGLFYSQMKLVNELLDTSGIQFVQCQKSRFIYSDKFSNIEGIESRELAELFGEVGVLNLFFVDRIDIAAGVEFEHEENDYVLFRNAAASKGIISHELGHFMSLEHTFLGFNELVDGSNCNTAGDFVCDTPADPNQFNLCSYVGTGTDANGDFYQPDSINIMSYSGCYERFTPGQIERARTFLITQRDYLACENICIKRDFEIHNALNTEINNGWIKVDAFSKKDGFQFSWNGPNGYTANTDSISSLYSGWYHVTISNDSCEVFDSVYVDVAYGCRSEYSTAVMAFEVVYEKNPKKIYWTISDSLDNIVFKLGETHPYYPDSAGIYLDTVCLLGGQSYQLEVSSFEVGVLEGSKYTLYCSTGRNVLANNLGQVVRTNNWPQPEVLESFEMECYPYIDYEVSSNNATAINKKDGSAQVVASVDTGSFSIEWVGPNNFHSNGSNIENLQFGWYYITLTATNLAVRKDSVYIDHPGCEVGESMVRISMHMPSNVHRNYWKVKDIQSNIIKEVSDYTYKEYGVTYYDSLCLLVDSSYFFEAYNNGKNSWGFSSEITIKCEDEVVLANLKGVTDTENDSTDLEAVIPFVVSCEAIKGIDNRVVDAFAKASICYPDSINISALIRNEGHNMWSFPQKVILTDEFSQNNWELNVDDSLYANEQDTFIFQMTLPRPVNDTISFSIVVVDTNDFYNRNDSSSFILKLDSAYSEAMTVVTTKVIDSINDCSGEILILIDGGVPPYRITLNNEPMDLDSLKNLCAGDYDLVVADSLGCFVYQLVNIAGAVNVVENNVRKFSIVPNPNNGEFKIENISINDELTVLRIYSLQGKVLMHHNIAPFSSHKNLTGLSKGIYIVEITQNNLAVRKKMLIN